MDKSEVPTPALTRTRMLLSLNHLVDRHAEADVRARAEKELAPKLLPRSSVVAEPVPGVFEAAAAAAGVKGLGEENVNFLCCPSDTANSTCAAARDTKQNALLTMLLLLRHADAANDVPPALTDEDMSNDAIGAPIILTSAEPVQGKAALRV